MSTNQDFEIKADGLTLHGVRYAGGGKTPVICLHGLTRNVRDFEDVGPYLAATGRDAIALSMRGRGRSEYDPNYLNYHPLTYRTDVMAALDSLGIAQAVFLGTSLGGIITMLINETAPHRVKAAIINDVGPELAIEGITRIAGYAGKTKMHVADLSEAATEIRAINEVAFPNRDDDFWLTFARRTFRENADGTWTLDYDANIGRALVEAGPAPDLWAPWESLKDTPTLLLRGALSDLLSPAIVEKMRLAHPHFDYMEVPQVGHAPTLSEPESQASIEQFLAKIE